MNCVEAGHAQSHHWHHVPHDVRVKESQPALDWCWLHESDGRFAVSFFRFGYIDFYFDSLADAVLFKLTFG